MESYQKEQSRAGDDIFVSYSSNGETIISHTFSYWVVVLLSFFVRSDDACTTLNLYWISQPVGRVGGSSEGKGLVANQYLPHCATIWFPLRTFVVAVLTYFVDRVEGGTGGRSKESSPASSRTRTSCNNTSYTSHPPVYGSSWKTKRRGAPGHLALQSIIFFVISIFRLIGK